MNEYEAREQLDQLFWGVTAQFEPHYGPPGIEPIGMAIAVGRAVSIMYTREITEVRAALARIEAGLPNEGDYPQGPVSVSECNRRVTSLIQQERAKLNELEAHVSLMKEREGQ